MDDEQTVNLSPIEKMLKDHINKPNATKFFNRLVGENLLATSDTCFPPDINL